MCLTQIPPHMTDLGGRPTLFSSLTPCQTTTMPYKTSHHVYSKCMAMFWTKLDHTIFNFQAIYMMLTQKFTCPIPERNGGLTIPITFL